MLVAITVAIAAPVYIYVSNMPKSSSPVAVMLNLEYDEATGKLTITHLGGDTITDAITSDGSGGGDEGGDWGIQSSSFTASSSHNNYRYMGGLSPDKQNMVITKLHMRVTGGGTVAIGIYEGGSLGNPTGATLLTEAHNVAVSAGWNEIDVPDVSWNPNTVTWIGWCKNVNIYYSTSSGDCGDFQSGRGRWSQNSPSNADETSPMPSSPGAGGFDNYWYAVYAEYTITGDGGEVGFNNLVVKINGKILVDDESGEKWDIEPLSEVNFFGSGSRLTITFDGTLPEAGDIISVIYKPGSQLLKSKEI